MFDDVILDQSNIKINHGMEAIHILFICIFINENQYVIHVRMYVFVRDYYMRHF